MEQTMQTELDRVHVKLSGPIHVRDAGKLRNTLLAQLEEGRRNIVIDVGRVDLIDSSGLGVLIQIQQKAAALGGGMTLTGVSGVVKDVLELSRLDRVFKIE